jgi:drug/metabolite transporter (DMT)-like permease
MTSSWMLVAGLLFATMGACAKLLASQFSGAELSMYRSVFAFVAIGGFVMWKKKSLATPFRRGHFLRGMFGTVSLIGYFYTMTQLPLATAIMLNYTSPLWLTLLSTLLLRERFQPILLVSILLGAVGVAMLLRPTFSDNNMHAGLIGLASGFFAACAYVNVKKLGEAGEPEWRVVFYFGLAGLIGSAVVQLIWQRGFAPITMPSLLPLLAMGLAATLAQLAMTRAYHSGATIVVAAFAYSTVVFAAIIGWVFFDENLPLIAWAGMAIVVASGLLAKRNSGGTRITKAELPVEED